MDSILQQTIKNIVKRINSIENELEKHKKNISNNALYGIEPKLFIKGKFISFDKDNQTLQILVNGDIRFYSINNYYSEYIPFPDTTVVIFSEVTTDGKVAKIFAIKKGEIDKFTNYHNFIFKGLKNKEAIFHSKELGYLNFSMPVDLIDFYGIKLSDEVRFREVKYGIDQYFIPEVSDNIIKQNKLEILKNI